MPRFSAMPAFAAREYAGHDSARASMTGYFDTDLRSDAACCRNIVIERERLREDIARFSLRYAGHAALLGLMTEGFTLTSHE